MFDNDVRITGKHAMQIKYLANEISIFERYIDVYMVASIFGFLNGRKAEKDTSSEEYANILASTFSNERLRCDFLYRLIILLDDTTGCSAEERIDKAFRETAHDSSSEAFANNMKVFNSFVLGGIEKLYEEFTDGCETQDECIKKIYIIVKEFYDDLHIVQLDEKIHEAMGVDK